MKYEEETENLTLFSIFYIIIFVYAFFLRLP